MKRKKPATPEIQHRIFPKGAKVRVIRPNVLWAGRTGIVASVTPEGIHRVLVDSLMSPGRTQFRVDIPGSELEEI